MQGVVKAYDPVSRTGVVMCDTDLADYELLPRPSRGRCCACCGRASG